MWTALSAAAIWRSLSGSTVQSLCTCGSVNALDPPPGCQTCECFHFEEADEESGRRIRWIQVRSFQPSDRTRTDALRLQNPLNAEGNKNSPGSITDLMCRLMGLDTKLTGNCHSYRASSHHSRCLTHEVVSLKQELKFPLWALMLAMKLQSAQVQLRREPVRNLKIADSLNKEALNRTSPLLNQVSFWVFFNSLHLFTWPVPMKWWYCASYKHVSMISCW